MYKICFTFFHQEARAIMLATGGYFSDAQYQDNECHDQGKIERCRH